jgi:hypothetical protein
MTDIFLNYASEDLERVKLVVEALAARGRSSVGTATQLLA